MQFTLALRTQKNGYIPVNYQYPLSAAIYKIVNRADEQYAAFLHNTGYGTGRHSFKLFTFSQLNTPFTITGDRLYLKTGMAELTICFYVPEAAGAFIRGLFLNQEIEIADKRSRTKFIVETVEVKTTELPDSIDGLIDIKLLPLSPIVAGIKNEKGIYDFKAPDDPAFAACLVHNLIEKYKAINELPAREEAALKEQVLINPIFFSNAPKSRLITIKADTPEETRIRGWMNFQLHLKAPPPLVDLALGAGLGLYNAQGMGGIHLLN